VTRSPRPSPSVFAYCKRSNTGGGNGLGTRLDSTHSFSREKLNTLVSSSSCSSMRSLACPCSIHNSLLNPPIRVQTSSWGLWWSRHGLHEKRPLSEAKISPNRDRSWEMTYPLDWMRGPIRCLPRATRFLRLDHLKCVLRSCVRARARVCMCV